MEIKKNQQGRNNTTIIYILIGILLALAAFDVVLFLQKKKADSKVIVADNAKAAMRLQLDSLENQLDLAKLDKSKLTEQFTAKSDSLRAQIKFLRHQLDKGSLTAKELQEAQENVKQLRYFVAKYSEQVDDLKRENKNLSEERDTLKHSLATVNEKATTLAKQNQDLNTKVQQAAQLKINNVNVTPLKVKSSGKEKENTRAAVVKKIKIDFSLAPNTVAEKRLHDVYIRVLDPAGNLITSTESTSFNADAQDLQATFKNTIDYKGDDATYSFDWSNPLAFQKGTYTIILYTDGATMGKTTLTLK